MLEAAKISREIRVAKRSGEAGFNRAKRPHLGTLWESRKTSGLPCKGVQQEEKAMTTPKPRPSITHGESHSYPVLPLRDIVVFPHMIVPLFVGREKSIRALEEVMKNDALIMLPTQKNAADDDPA